MGILTLKSTVTINCGLKWKRLSHFQYVWRSRYVYGNSHRINVKNISKSVKYTPLRVYVLQYLRVVINTHVQWFTTKKNHYKEGHILTNYLIY